MFTKAGVFVRLIKVSSSMTHMAFDRADNLFVGYWLGMRLEESTVPIRVFDKNGTQICKFGDPDHSFGLCVDNDGLVWVASTNGSPSTSSFRVDCYGFSFD